MQACALPYSGSCTPHKLDEKRKNVTDLYIKDKLIIRTLCDEPDEFESNLLSDIDELDTKGVRECSSASWLFHDIPTYPYGYIGFLINSDLCQIQALYKEDSCVARTDLNGHHIIWKKELKSFVYLEAPDHPFNPTVTYKGAIEKNRVSTVKNIKKHMSKNIKKEKPTKYNEVVIDYRKESIAGIVAVINSRPRFSRNITNEEVLTASESFKDLVFSKMGLELPIMIYDCHSG